jgi:hypothetical protein
VTPPQAVVNLGLPSFSVVGLNGLAKPRSGVRSTGEALSFVRA